MPVGAWTLFNKGELKFTQGLIDLDSHNFKLALCGSTQALGRTFTGSSTDCRYSDLTDELATANGYTAGGLLLSGVSLSQAANVVTWLATDASWTLTGSLVFKYGVIYDDSNANKDLFCFFDANDTSGSSTVTAAVSPLLIPLSSGIVTVTS